MPIPFGGNCSPSGGTTLPQIPWSYVTAFADTPKPVYQPRDPNNPVAR